MSHLARLNWVCLRVTARVGGNLCMLWNKVGPQTKCLLRHAFNEVACCPTTHNIISLWVQVLTSLSLPPSLSCSLRLRLFGKTRDRWGGNTRLLIDGLCSTQPSTNALGMNVCVYLDDMHTYVCDMQLHTCTASSFFLTYLVSASYHTQQQRHLVRSLHILAHRYMYTYRQ